MMEMDEVNWDAYAELEENMVNNLLDECTTLLRCPDRDCRQNGAVGAEEMP